MAFKGAISFGLVYIPIKLEAAAISNEVSFNQLERGTMSRIRYKKTCDECEGRFVEQKDIVKAFEYEKGRYVVFEPEDFEKIKTKRDKSITIERFVALDEIDPIYYERTYYVIPDGADKAYCLLRDSLESEGKVGIAKSVIGTKETLIAIRVKGGQMLLSTLYFAAEIRVNPAKHIDIKASKEEEQLAKMIIESMSGAFEIEKYKDEYTQRVRQAIMAKVAGKEIAVPKHEHSDKVIDLMAALKASLKNSKKKDDEPDEATAKPGNKAKPKTGARATSAVKNAKKAAK